MPVCKKVMFVGWLLDVFAIQPPFLATICIDNSWLIIPVDFAVLVPCLHTICPNDCRLVITSVNFAVMVPHLAAICVNDGGLIITSVKKAVLIPCLVTVCVNDSRFITTSVKSTVQFPSAISAHVNIDHGEVIFPTGCADGTHFTQAFHNLHKYMIGLYICACDK